MISAATRMADAIRCLDRGMAAVETLLVAACMLGGAAMSFALVAARYIFGVALSGFEELSVYLIVWMTFVGMVVADRRGQHIAIDVVHYLVGPSTRALLRRAVDGLKGLVGLMLAWLALEEVQFSHMLGETAVSALETPVWIVMAVMPATFLIVGLRNLARAVIPAARVPDADSAPSRSVE